MRTFLGGCHCGAVRFEVSLDRFEAEDCNCSICAKKGFVHVIVPREQFKLLQGENALTTYTFNTKEARHTFCRICGIHPFYSPRSHPDGMDVNLRCFDEDVMSLFRIQKFDGQNWEASIGSLRARVRIES